MTNIAKRNEMHELELSMGRVIHGTCRPGWLIPPLVPATLRCGAEDSIRLFLWVAHISKLANDLTCSEFGKRKREEMNECEWRAGLRAYR